MAKTSLKVRQSRPQKYKVREYTRCERCGRPHSVYSKFHLCRICLRDNGARVSSFRRQFAEKIGVNETGVVPMIDPAPHLTAFVHGDQLPERHGLAPAARFRVDKCYLLVSPFEKKTGCRHRIEIER